MPGEYDPPRKAYRGPRYRKWYAAIHPHWIEVALTVALVGVGGAQVLIYLRQAEIMTTQAAIMNKQTGIAIATDRAFVNFDSLNVVSVDTGRFGPGKVVGIFFGVVNSGNVATKEFRALIACKPATPDEVRSKSDPFDFFVWDESKAVEDVIGPKGKDTVGECNVTPADISKIESGDLQMYLLGEVRYRDRIDPSALHRTRLSQRFYVSHVSTDENGIVHFIHSTEISGKNNCADEECHNS